jgi:hypothetical protein
LINKICRNRELKKEITVPKKVVQDYMEFSDFQLDEGHYYEDDYNIVQEVEESANGDSGIFGMKKSPYHQRRKKSKKLTISDLNKATSQFTAKSLMELLKTPNVRKRPKLLK